MQTHVSFDRRDDVGYLTLACDEAGKPATLDLLVLDELAASLEEIASCTNVLRAVVVGAERGDSQRYFVVGANVNALATLDAETIVPWVQKGHAVLDQLEALPLPVIARVEGYALGGGLELAMACDLIVASHEARFGQPEATLGVVPGWGGSYRLPRRVGLARAKELFFSGQIIDAHRAYEIGLVDFVGHADELAEHLASLLERIRACSPLAISQTKKLVANSLHVTLRQSGVQEAEASRVCMSAGDTQARVAAFLEGRRKGGRGSPNDG
jgi:enoyl-CoA hydratase